MPVTTATLKEMGVSEQMDVAVRMALFKRTDGDAHNLIDNRMEAHRDTLGLDMWLFVVKQYDPISVKAAQDERSKLMEGRPRRPRPTVVRALDQAPRVGGEDD